MGVQQPWETSWAAQVPAPHCEAASGSNFFVLSKAKAGPHYRQTDQQEQGPSLNPIILLGMSILSFFPGTVLLGFTKGVGPLGAAERHSKYRHIFGGTNKNGI